MKFNKSSVDSMSVPWIESDFAKEILKTQKVSNKLRDQANFFINNGYLILRNVLSKKIINEVIKDYEKIINSKSFKKKILIIFTTTNTLELLKAGKKK